MSDQELIAVIAPILMALVVAAVLIFNKINREKLLALIRDVTPDVIEPFVIQAFDMAWKAAEQKAKKLGGMSNEEKLAWAMNAAAALLAFLRTGKLTEDANEAMIEWRLYEEHQIAPAQESFVYSAADVLESVPLGESRRGVVGSSSGKPIHTWTRTGEEETPTPGG